MAEDVVATEVLLVWISVRLHELRTHAEVDQSELHVPTLTWTRTNVLQLQVPVRVSEAVESLQSGYELLQHRENECHLLRLRRDGRLPVLQGGAAVRHEYLTEVLSDFVTEKAREPVVLGAFL